MSHLDDVALAMALQEEEYERAGRPPPVRPTLRPAAVAPLAPPPPPPPPAFDDEYVRRIEQQERDADIARRFQQEEDYNISGRRQPSDSQIAQQQKDAEMALQMQQELGDEELARQLAQSEQRRAAGAAAQAAAAGNARNKWTVRRTLSYFAPLVFIVVGAVALVYALGGNNAIPIPILPDNFDDNFWDDEDPWQGMTPGQVNKWNVNSGGLSLALVNALEDHWEPYFFTAADNWDNGAPDALTLTTVKKQPDFDCEPENGKLKVCNGNYGDTRWRGINQILISNNYIVASAARMNDYFLTAASDAQRQYTMCHEMGHGFGLPHSDEDFFNADLGNCMDYTSNPTRNQHPDTSNYEFLADLYGTVPPFRRERERRKLPASKEQTLLEEIPEWLQSKTKQVLTAVESRIDFSNNDGWKLLHRTDRGEAHEVALGGGYSVQVHLLLNPPHD